MTRPILPKNNFFDGQEVTETDMDVEQTAWHDSLANNTDFIAGSGIEQEFAAQRVLFDSSSVPASVSTLISGQNFDGEPIYPNDAFGLAVFIQPSDTTNGNQLEVELTGALLDGSKNTRVYIFGTTLGGGFIHEVMTFEKNESQVTRKYFASVVSFMTQDFRGNQNTVIDGVKSRDSLGRLRILESVPMTLVRDVIMASQLLEPSMDYVNFKSATPSKNLNTLLNEIAATESLNAVDLKINVTATSTRSLPANDSTGLIVGQKFQAKTNNIQNIAILLSVAENTLAAPGAEFDWSGDIVVGVRPLQTTAQCPTDAIPNTAIEFDPALSPIAEVSFDQAEMLDQGITLNGSKQQVDFVFTQSLLGNPNLPPSIEPGKYYVLTVRRSGDISKGNIVLQEAANTDATPGVVDNQRMSVFSQNVWTDVPESDMWFKVNTNALRVTDGTAFDDGVQITSPRTKRNAATGLDESFIEGYHSFIDVSQTTENYVTVQKSVAFTDSIPHPSTGNLVFSRSEDAVNVSVISQATLTGLIDARDEPIVLGSARDTNPVGNPSITGITGFPGLLRANTFTIIQPTADITLNNLVGSVLVPNIDEASLKYRIIRVDVISDAYGDVNGDSVIDLKDVARAQFLEGYSKSLDGGTVPPATQLASIVSGAVTIEEIIRADVTEDGVISILDSQAIQQNIVLGTAFDAGDSFTRVVLTVESLSNPLTTTPDMLSADPTFNSVPFTSINYRIDFVPLWKPHNVLVTDLRRFVPKTFTSILSTDITGTTPTGGSNTSFVPGNVLLGGQLLAPDGTDYSMDLETNTVIIELPEGSTQGEVDVFTNFIKGTMTYYDGSAVKTSALANKQVKVSTAIQSFVKDSDGYDFQSVDGYSAIETTIALLYMQDSGVLRIRADNVRNIITRPELRTKIILTVFLKKAGFRNSEVTVSSTALQELLVLV